VIAVLGGLGAALSWAATGVCGQRAARTIGELSTFAWASVTGLVIVIVPAAVGLISSTPSARTLLALVGAGFFNVLGLVAQFSALRRGRVSVIVPVSSAEGAVAAMIAVAAGAHLPTAGWAAVGVLIAGVLITAASQWPRGDAASTGDGLRPVGLAVIAALFFGCGLFLQGKAGASAPLGLAIAPPSFMGVLVVAVPLASAGRITSPRGARVWIVGVAAAELIGFVCYVVGARHSLPVAAVLSSQYATISVLLSVVFLRERLSSGQLVGFALTILGVTVLSLLG
jgi:drug/metabolite transporter (DMT)-like permease